MMKRTTHIDVLKQQVFVGEQFIVVQATEKQPVQLKLTARGASEAQAVAFTAPAVVSRHVYAVEAEASPTELAGRATRLRRQHKEDNVTWPRLDLTSLHLAAAITDRKIYKPREPIRLFVASLTTPQSAAHLTLRRAGQVILSSEVQLAAGVALTTLEDLDEGEYTVLLEASQQWTAECSFTVAAYSLSLLTAVLEKHQYEKQRLGFVITLRQLDQLYNGEAEIGLQCQVCGGRVVATKKVTVRDGRLAAAFDVSGHGGPFHVQMTTPGGETATVSFPNTGREVRESVPLSTLGHQAMAGLLPMPDAEYVRGLHISRRGVATTPFLADGVVAVSGKLKALVNGGPLQVVTINPTTQETHVQDYATVSNGQVLEVAVQAPYTLYTIGGLADGKPFEGWGVFIRPEELKLSLDTPKSVKPGDDITVRVESTKPAQCLLLVYDARLEHEDLIPKLAERLFRSLRNNTVHLATSYMQPLDKWLELSGFGTSRAGTIPGLMLARAPAMDMPTFLSAAEGPVARTLTAMTGAAPAAEAIEATTNRTDFPEMVLVDLFPLEAVAERVVGLGEQIATWRCRAYAVRDLDYAEATADVQATKDAYVELDLPAFVSPGDEVYARARYHAPVAGDLTVQTAVGVVRQRVQGNGVLDVKVTGPGEVVATLSAGREPDIVSRVVGMPGRQRVTMSRLMILKGGESVEGERVVVYPTIGMVIKDTIESLIQYPFG